MKRYSQALRRQSRPRAFFAGALLLALLFTGNVWGQNFYVGANTGYQQSFNGYSTVEVDETSGKEIERYKELHFVNGINAGLSFGYKFNPHFSAELGIAYFMGMKQQIIDKYEFVSLETVISTTMLKFRPSVIASTNLTGLNAYGKLGLVVGNVSFVVDTKSKDNRSATMLNVVEKYSGGMALGIQTAVGGRYDLSKLSFFAELAIINMAYAPKKSETTLAEMDGQNILPFMTEREKKTEYLREVEYDNNPPNENEPNQALKSKFPMNSIGLNVGVMFRF